MPPYLIQLIDILYDSFQVLLLMQLKKCLFWEINKIQTFITDDYASYSTTICDLDAYIKL